MNITWEKGISKMLIFFRQQIIIDPEEKEESIIDGKLMMAFNIHNEVCCVQMNGGVCLDYEQVTLKMFLFLFFSLSEFECF